MNNKHINHLHWRAGFGLTYPELQDRMGLERQELVDELFEKSASSTPLEIDLSDIVLNVPFREIPEEDQAEFGMRSQQLLLDLNEAWIYRLAETEEVLREKMTLFWSNHFACIADYTVFTQDLNNILRDHALGNFKDMVLAVSKSPAMILFLNNVQNKKAHPNENFARELMELFTIGRGNYTEEDIKESARAFTGWMTNESGEFVFNKWVHDEGDKTFMGQTGNFGGEDIIDIIFQQEVMGEFVCTKLYKYLVNEVVDTGHVAEMTEVFRQDWDITKLLRHVFMSDWFYDEVNIGSKIKSPAEFLVGLQKQFHIEYEDQKILLFIQKSLGQILFHPPNVAGWPGGRRWIDSSSLMMRLKLPSTILNDGIIEASWKDDQAELLPMMDKIREKVHEIMQCTPDWDPFLQALADATAEELIEFLLLPEPEEGVETIIQSIDVRDLKDATIQLLSTPEYQMC